MKNQNLPVQTSFNECLELAKQVAQSGLFQQWNTPAKAVIGMQLAIAEGKHPISAMQRYHIMDMRGKITIAKTAQAMLSDFIDAGGSVEWHEMSKEKAEATFTPPNGKPLKLAFSKADAIEAGIVNKDVWKNWSVDMLCNRLITRVLRKIYPQSTGLMYDQDEVKYSCPETEEKPEMKNITPQKQMFEQKTLPECEPETMEIDRAIMESEVTYDVDGNNVQETTLSAFEEKILELDEAKTLEYLRKIGWLDKDQNILDLSEKHKNMIVNRFDNFKNKIRKEK